MHVHLKDVVSYAGTDYLVAGLVTYDLQHHKRVLARLVGGERVLWMEPLVGDLDERVLFLEEIHDLDMTTPPPEQICYKDGTYLHVLAGHADVATSGQTPGRASGTCDLWRLRAAGDVFIQIEKWPDALVILAGPSAHQSMLQIRPAK
jgi:hypothetical protein